MIERRPVVKFIGEEEVGHFAGRLLVCPHFVVLRFSALPRGAGGMVRSWILPLPVEFQVFSC